MNPTLTTLLQRVESAKGGDRELAHDLCLLFMKRDDYPSLSGLIVSALGDGIEAVGAALELVERLLPEANTYGVQKDRMAWSAFISRNFVKEGHWHHEAEAPTAPLALLKALLRTLAAQEGDG